MKKIENKERLRALLKELKNRQSLVNSLFPAQKDAVLDPNRRQAWLTSRRAGKTTAAAVMLLDGARKHPGDDFAYIALTRPSAKNITWKMFKMLCKEHNIKAKFLEGQLAIELRNGSTINLYGADQANWIERIEGTKHRAVIIDEAGLHDPKLLKSMINESIGPTLVDTKGKLALIGRPGKKMIGMFYDITSETGKESGWALHKWHSFENPHIEQQFREEIDTLKSNNPKIMEDPSFRRNYLGEWAEEDADLLVYRYSAHKNAISEFRDEPGTKYILGVDFGFVDSAAFCLGAYSENSPDLVVVESIKRSGMWSDQIASVIKDYMDRYRGLTIWGDPSRKSTLSELQIRWGIPIQSATRKNKIERIMSANTDLNLGRVKFLNPDACAVVSEMRELRKKEKPSGQWEESPLYPNDACDSFLYIHGESYHYRYKSARIEPEYGTEAFWKQEEERIESELESQLDEEGLVL